MRDVAEIVKGETPRQGRMVGDIQLLVKMVTQAGANGMELKKMIIWQGEKYGTPPFAK